MRRRGKRIKFTDEQIKELSENPFTSEVTYYQIYYTLEFQNLFLARYEKGESSVEIFESMGYDVFILGDNRVYGFAGRLRRRLESGRELIEVHKNTKIEEPQKVDYNTLPAQQSVASMQRELRYLRQQVEFLKKLQNWTTTKSRGIDYG